MNASFFSINECAVLYADLVKDIMHCRKKGLEREKEIEMCFQIATHYYQRLMQRVEGSGFEKQKDEIFFFKKIKPLFLSEMEQVGLCTHAELFKATAAPAEFEKFYRRELQRLDKFKRENAEFYQYIVSEATNRDQELFTKFPGEAFRSAYDGLIGTWLALNEYTEFITRELTQLCKTP
jgi:hypothetical protein